MTSYERDQDYWNALHWLNAVAPTKVVGAFNKQCREELAVRGLAPRPLYNPARWADQLRTSARSVTRRNIQTAMLRAGGKSKDHWVMSVVDQAERTAERAEMDRQISVLKRLGYQAKAEADLEQKEPV